jgi:hypothetical protein
MRLLNGTVAAQRTIVVFGVHTTVYGVTWDGNPAVVPVQFRDEEGTNKRGYLESELMEI